MKAIVVKTPNTAKSQKADIFQRLPLIGTHTGFSKISRTAGGCQSLLEGSVMIYPCVSADCRICTR